MDEFLGTHTPRLDDKGRLFLPARFRAALAGGLVVTTGQEGCLYVYPTAEFHRISAAMQSAPSSSRVVRDFVRVFRASAHPDTPDKQGRVTIPAPLRTYADLDRSARSSATATGSRSGTPPPGTTTSSRSCPPTPRTPWTRRRWSRGSDARSPTARPPSRHRHAPTDDPTDDPTAGLQPTRLPTRLPPCRARIGWGPAAGSPRSRTRRTPQPSTRPPHHSSTDGGHDEQPRRRRRTARPRAARPHRRPARAGARRRRVRSASTARSGWGATPRRSSSGCPDARVIGIDRDEEALTLSGERLARFGDRFVGVHAVYDDIADRARGARGRGRPRHPVRPRCLLPPARRARARVRLPARRTARHADGPVAPASPRPTCSTPTATATWPGS